MGDRKKNREAIDARVAKIGTAGCSLAYFCCWEGVNPRRGLKPRKLDYMHGGRCSKNPGKANGGKACIEISDTVFKHEAQLKMLIKTFE